MRSFSPTLECSTVSGDLCVVFVFCFGVLELDEETRDVSRVGLDSLGLLEYFF